MAKLLMRKRKPTVSFPAELESEKILGKFYGIYIDTTNYYNIISYLHPDNNFPEVKCIGEIFGAKPEELPTEGQLYGYFEANELCFIDADGKKCKKEPYSLKLDIFSRNTGILESDIMLKKGAMFIGCGSVGSLFALELARAGVGRFLLIDNDIFAYHNISRHQCGILDVGKLKVDALKERILQINPKAEIVTQACTVQEVPLSVFDSFCDKNTIVVGGADNREGDLYANQIAKEVGMPLMSVGCWERAFAGEIFYCLPTGMPDYSDLMYAIGGLSGRVNQNKKFYTNEEDLEKAIFEPGISVDINFVTTIAVKLALDILNIDNDRYTPRLINNLSQFTLVCNTNNPKIGGDNAEIFSYPLQVTTSIEVPRAPVINDSEE
ncbi:ThiF family adenylyltransferase [Dysgonomonas sp. 216]|uniref:ThiF family adenylyltransferase n=1 Tax=Dysgonomonas sp. 216 TaxID=2302934 RepID=UPI0013D42FE3|nr:ThiF family adenylyltransferase [Dysgonomonas sp. 216]NDW17350.1 ThiF family adenylyltransferase [Dysgonomonas sp. 216]